MAGSKLGLWLLCLLGSGCLLWVAAISMEDLANARPYSFSTLNVQNNGVTAAKGADLKVSFIQLGEQKWPDNTWAMPFEVDTLGDPKTAAPTLEETVAAVRTMFQQVVAAGYDNCALLNTSANPLSIVTMRTTGTRLDTRVAYNFTAKCVTKGAPLSSVTIAPTANFGYGSGLCTPVPATSKTLPVLIAQYTAVLVPDPVTALFSRQLSFSSVGNLTAVGMTTVELSISYKPPGFHTVASVMDPTKANTWTPASPVDSNALSNLTTLYKIMVNPIDRHRMYLFGSQYPCLTVGARSFPPLVAEGDAWFIGSFGWNGEKVFSPEVKVFPALPETNNANPGEGPGGNGGPPSGMPRSINMTNYGCLPADVLTKSLGVVDGSSGASTARCAKLAHDSGFDLFGMTPGTAQWSFNCLTAESPTTTVDNLRDSFVENDTCDAPCWPNQSQPMPTCGSSSGHAFLFGIVGYAA